MKSRPLDILSTLLLIVALGSIFYIVLPKHREPITSTRPMPNSLHGVDTLAIISGDKIFASSDTIIDR